MIRGQVPQAMAHDKTKHKPFRHGEATSPPLTYKQGPTSDGQHHLHYELSPFAHHREDVHGTFDRPTHKKINKKQEAEMDRDFGK